MRAFGWYAPLVAGIVACGPARDEPAAPKPIFRHVDTRLGTIRLGEPWDAARVPGAAPSDTVVALPVGSFHGAQAIRVHRTPQAVVTSVMFDYPQSADFQRMHAEYTDLLGSPVQHHRPADDEAPETLVWQDRETRFELTRNPRRSVSTIYSRLTDLP